MPPGAYSIRSQFRGATVLLTGATGYVGGLVLEALLRTTDVGRVLVLLRPKAGAAPDARLAQLLQVRWLHVAVLRQHAAYHYCCPDAHLSAAPRQGANPQPCRNACRWQRRHTRPQHCLADRLTCSRTRPLEHPPKRRPSSNVRAHTHPTPPQQIRTGQHLPESQRRPPPHR
jgi:hypothetical protein